MHEDEDVGEGGDEGLHEVAIEVDTLEDTQVTILMERPHRGQLVVFHPSDIVLILRRYDRGRGGYRGRGAPPQ